MIRYDKKLNQEINRVIRNFNQKVTRLEKDERNLLLPDKITKKQIKDSVYSRSELKRKLEELKRFSTRGAEEVIETMGGVKVSRYELENMKRRASLAKAKITRELHRMERTNPTISGKKQSFTFAQMGDEFYINLSAKREALQKKISKLGKDEYSQYKGLINKILQFGSYQDYVFKENYLKMLKDTSYFYGLNEQYDKISEKLMKLNTKDFLKVYKSDKSIQALIYYYPEVSKGFMNPSDLKDDVESLFDSLSENIDTILDSYK